ncbi:hypothetical protein [Magnetococcus sp. PR-3]|uniref:hypothetical protein n=1 Tax=Magnetococcus sp. PR-3 TaxID=3120355 RepID=UPI002FCE62A7
MKRAKGKVETDILLIDIVGFSLLSDDEQFLTVNLLNDGIDESLHFIGIPDVLDDAMEVVRGMVPTGDGCYVILNPKLSGYAPILALGLRNILLYKSRQAGGLFSGVRVSAHTGVVIPFKDATGKENFIGSGMNNCARIQSIPDFLKSEAASFAGDENWVNVSTACWTRFNQKFDHSQLNNNGFRFSEQFQFKDKHGISHACLFIDLSRVWVSGL